MQCIRPSLYSVALVAANAESRAIALRAGRIHNVSSIHHRFPRTPLTTPDPIPNTATARERERIWKIVSHSPLASLWDLQGLSPYEIARRTLKSAIADRLFSRAAELGFYFLFSLFPTLICASAILGM